MQSQHLILILLIFSQAALAQQPTSTQTSLFNELASEGLAKLEIITDLDGLYQDRSYQKYHPSYIKVQLPDGDTFAGKAKTRTRGKFRCKKCDYPPLKLKFPKAVLEANNFETWNKYKLVYPCKAGKKFQHYIYKEYLAYKIYNLITDKSFRTELVDIVIKDSLQNQEDIQFTGFVLEDKDELSHRLQGTGEKVSKISPTKLAQQEYAVFQVFQYMIGNSDWIPPIGHNMEIIATNSGELLPIPFDFDFSGFVGAYYAVPNSNFPIDDIYHRYFLGHHKDINELKPAIDLFNSKKDAILQLVKDFKYLPNSEKAVIIAFIKDFYKTIEKPKKLEKEFCHALPKNMQKFY